MTPLQMLATAAFAVVLVLLLWRPQVGILAFIIYYPLNDYVPRLPLPGFNAETLLLGVTGSMTLLRFGLRVPPLRYTAPLLAMLMTFLMSWGIASLTQASVFHVEADTWGFFKIVKASLFPMLLASNTKSRFSEPFGGG